MFNLLIFNEEIKAGFKTSLKQKQVTFDNQQAKAA
jgi:hypothetical protein